MAKKYILDTSVLINDPYAFESFENNEVIIPITVLDELDKLKKMPNETGKYARIAIRLLDDVSNNGDINQGIILKNNTLLKIDPKIYENNFGDSLYGDVRIVACAYNHFLNKNDEVILVSRDFNLRVRAKSLGIKTENYEKNRIDLVDLYEGYSVIYNQDAVEDLITHGYINPAHYGIHLFPNECVEFVDSYGTRMALAKKTHDRLKLVRPFYPWELSPRNKEQIFAMNLIADTNVPLVSLTGKAGCGKTLITLATCLELLLNQNKYQKFIIYRPIQEVGKNIGYLPGPQPLDAKILTPNGWSTMGDIQPNDNVIGVDGKAKKVLKVFPKGKKEVFKIVFSDDSFTESCEDHLWCIKSDSGEIIKSLKEIKNNFKENFYEIPISKPVEFNVQKTEVHPYLMGTAISFNSFSNNVLNIKDSYKINSIENRIALLNGLIDVGGFVKNNNLFYETKHESLAKDIQFLIQSLGGLAVIEKHENFELKISLPENIKPFNYKKINYKHSSYNRKIVDIQSIGIKETKCILVESEDHLYLTDDFIVTHNTKEEKLEPWFEAIMDNFELLFSSSHGAERWKTNFELMKKKDRIQLDAITYIRGRSIPNALILMEEVQNLSKEEIKTVLTRVGEGSKIILTGDIEQIDNRDLDALNNGLTYTIEKFKESELAGHITFSQGERSALATKASEIL